MEAPRFRSLKLQRLVEGFLERIKDVYPEVSMYMADALARENIVGWHSVENPNEGGKLYAMYIPPICLFDGIALHERMFYIFDRLSEVLKDREVVVNWVTLQALVDEVLRDGSFYLLFPRFFCHSGPPLIVHYIYLNDWVPICRGGYRVGPGQPWPPGHLVIGPNEDLTSLNCPGCLAKLAESPES